VSRRPALAGVISRILAPALLAVLVCVAAGAEAPDDGSADERAWTRLIDELDALRTANDVAGAALLIADAQGLRRCAAIGLADRATRRPMRCDSLVRIGSVTKVFTGLTFLDLEADGLLDLDRPVRELVDDPPFSNPWAATHPVTLAQLLEHTAGLGDMTRREFDQLEPLSLDDALAVDPASRRLRWPPGLHSSYSNSGAGVAAWVMERATGLDFEAEAIRRVLRPLGMPSATFTHSDAIERDRVTGYDSDGRTVIPYWHVLYRPFGGLNVRFDEMAGLLQVLLGDGRIDGDRLFSADQVRRLETPRTTLAARQGLAFGYGFGNYASVHRRIVFHGHGGDADGYLSRYAYSHRTGSGYFLLINAYQASTLRAMGNAVLDFLVAGHAPAVVAPVARPRSDLAALTGPYHSVTSRFAQPARELEVILEGDHLVLVRGDRRQRLHPVGPGLFRRDFEAVATTAFIALDGALYLQGPFGNYLRDDDPER